MIGPRRPHGWSAIASIHARLRVRVAMLLLLDFFPLPAHQSRSSETGPLLIRVQSASGLLCQQTSSLGAQACVCRRCLSIRFARSTRLVRLDQSSSCASLKSELMELCNLNQRQRQRQSTNSLNSARHNQSVSCMAN